MPYEKMKEDASPGEPQPPTQSAVVNVHPGPVVQQAGNAFVSNVPLVFPPSGPQPMVFMKQPRKPLSKTRARLFVGMGATQLTTGIVAIVLNAVSTGLMVPYTAFVGPGFWCGLMYIIAGAFGIAGGKKSKTGFMVTFMVLSIISSVITTGLITTAAIGLSDNYWWDCIYDRRTYNSDIGSWDYDYGARHFCDTVSEVVNSFLLICGILELVISIISSALCCSVVCCRGQTTYVACPVQYNPGTHGVTIGTATQGHIASTEN